MVGKSTASHQHRPAVTELAARDLSAVVAANGILFFTVPRNMEGDSGTGKPVLSLQSFSNPCELPSSTRVYRGQDLNADDATP
jgi:hypothetical protein